MREIQLSSDKALLVKVPVGSFDFKIFHENGHTRLLYDVGKATCYSEHLNANVVLPDIKWMNLHLNQIKNYDVRNTASKLTEQQARELGFERSTISGVTKYHYKNLWSLQALDIFKLYLKDNSCYLENPYGAYPMKTDDFEYDGGQEAYEVEVENWKSAEENTGEWLILIENK